MKMKNWIMGVAITFALAFGMSTGASALVADFTGTLSNSPFDIGETGGATKEILGDQDGGHLFNHAWEFTLNSESNMSGTLTDNNTTRPSFDLTDLVIALYNAADTTFTTALGTFACFTCNTDVDNPFVSFAFGPLTAGDYVFLVSGATTDSSTFNGQYTVQTSVSAVPLPAAIWLFISALVGLVSFARIRRDGTPA